MIDVDSSDQIIVQMNVNCQMDTAGGQHRFNAAVQSLYEF